jgi:hypothetical protein
MGIATVEAVSVVHEIVDGYYHPTAIDKRSVSGDNVRTEGLDVTGALLGERRVWCVRATGSPSSAGPSTRSPSACW